MVTSEPSQLATYQEKGMAAHASNIPPRPAAFRAIGSTDHLQNALAMGDGSDVVSDLAMRHKQMSGPCVPTDARCVHGWRREHSGGTRGMHRHCGERRHGRGTAIREHSALYLNAEAGGAPGEGVKALQAIMHALSG
eukprot:364790-Chlamydomonas_euryale.AAC.13